VAEEALSISPQEIRFAGRLHRLFPTPRATKRFANTWRLLKAGIPLRDLSDFEGADEAPGLFRAPMLLLALVVGSPAGAETILRRLFDTAVAGGDALTGLRALAAEGGTMPLLADIIAILEEPDFPRAPELFRRWLPRVSRFSFDLGRGFGFEE
jgi:hypothetical protein